MSLSPGLVINPACFLPLPNDAPDAALADGHDEFINRGILRERENINRFNLAVVRILEFLGNVDGGNVGTDRSLHIRVLQRQRNVLLLVRKFRAKLSAARHVFGLVCCHAGLLDDPELVRADGGIDGALGIDWVAGLAITSCKRDIAVTYLGRDNEIASASCPGTALCFL